MAIVVAFFFNEKLDVKRMDAKRELKWGKLK